MTGLEINLFGEFRVWRDGQLVEGKEWDRQKTRSLLKLLLTRPGRAFSRDEIMEALWPDTSPKAAERSLWVTVSLLRRVLEPNLARGSDSSYILQKRPGYAFNREADCWMDTWRFEEHHDKAEVARQAEKLDEAIREYRAALDLVKGEFLAEDPYEEWAVEAREEWQERLLSALLGLAECLAQKGRYTEAIESCKEALALDGYREDLHRRLMLYHYCAGEQALALRAYRDYAGKLEEELGTTPSPELVHLKEWIERRDVPGVDEGRRRYPRPRRPLRFPYSLSRIHFAGRDKELSLLTEQLREATEGGGGAVAVEGEAGVGKTRLVEEFLGCARSRDVRVLTGRCYERELAAPLEPIVDALEPLIDTQDILATEAGIPEFAGSKQTAQHESTRVYRVLARELIEASHNVDYEALVLFVDDVQWADAATLDFLVYVARRITGERILLLFTYRREDVPALSGWLHHLAEKRAVKATLNLERLSLRDLTQILSGMSSRGFDELPSLAESLHRESEGNPFYAVEYLRWLIEAGIVRIDSRRRICALEREVLEEGMLPSGVRSLIEARLASLDEGTRKLLELAAVVGRGFDLGLLCRATARGEAEAFELMKPAVASGLIVETTEEAYYLSHDKLRQALYEGIDAPYRRNLHLQVARALEETGGEPAELAHHYLRAKEWQPALDNLVVAGERAEESCAWQTALEHYARALVAAEKLPGSEEKRFGLLAARERLLEHLDHREERAETVEEMFKLARSFGDRARMAEVHIRRIGALGAVSDLGGAEEATRDAVAIFRELEDRGGEARVHREIGYVRWADKEYSGALESNFRALHIYRELGDRRAEAGTAGNIAQVYRGMGHHEQALQWADEATRIHRELGDKIGAGMRFTTMAAIYRERGDLETALSLNLETLRYNNEAGAKNLNVAQHNTCGTLYLSLGRSRKALEHFGAAAHLAGEIGYPRDEGYSLRGLGIALETTGDAEGAAEAYRRAAGLLEAAYEESGIDEDLSAKAEILNLLAAVLHRVLDRPREALDAYEAAARIYRSLGDGGRLCKLSLGWGGLLWQVGNLEASARRYEEALGLARERGAPPREASALASLGVVYRDLGRLRDSLRCGRQAAGLLRRFDDARAEAYVVASLAESYARLGYYPSALSCLRRSLRLRRKTGDAEGEVRVLRYLAEIYESSGDTTRACEALERAVRKEKALEETSMVPSAGGS